MKENKELTKLQDKPEGKVKKAFHKFIDIMNKKWLINGVNTILLVAIIIAIYMGVTILLKKVNLPEIDCTSDKIYSLSDETKTKISAIDKEIKITLINYGSNETMNSMINRYRALNKIISVESIDNLASRTDLMTKYSLSSTDTLIIIESGEKETTLSQYDLYTYDYTTYEQIDTTEESLTNAIIDVTSEVRSKVYFMSNHIAYPTTYYSSFMQELKEDANDVETFDLFATGSVPDDCSCLVITTLQEDITEGERDSLIEYVNKGGKLLLLCGANTENIALTNFQQVLDLYGITIENGVIFEGKADNMLSQYPDMIIEDIQTSSVTKYMSMNLKACFVDAAPIVLEEDYTKQEELGVTYETLATTSSSAFIRTNIQLTSASRTSEDSEEGQYNIGVLAKKEIGDNVTSKLIIYSNELFATDMPIQIGNYRYAFISLCNNADVAANAVAYLNEKENTITIRKNYDTVTYTPTKAQQNTVMSIIFITPLVIMVIGLIVWRFRRIRNK